MARKCAYCEGSGKVRLLRSWFLSDGYTLNRCGICAGSGESDYRPAPDALAGQRRLYAALDAAHAPPPEEKKP